MNDSRHHAPAPEASFAHAGIAAAAGDWRASDDHEARFGIVVARFNAAITDSLHAGAVDALLAGGVAPERIESVQVPGAVEIPAVASAMAGAGFRGVIALGCVIRGETAHFDYVCQAATQGCTSVAAATGMPVGFGVLTVDTVEQAEARAVHPDQDPAGHNVGADAAQAVLESCAVIQSLVR